MIKYWSNWRIFGASVLLALTSTPFLASVYEDLFQVTGGWIYPAEFSSYPMTFFFLYTLFLSFFYVVFSNKFVISAFAYFIALPFLAFLINGKHLVAGFLVVTVGLLLGNLFRKRRIDEIKQ